MSVYDLPIDPYFICEPDPNNPGWATWDLRDSGRYNDFLGPVSVRRIGDGPAEVRMFLEKKHSNMGNVAHGGTTMGFIDCAIFGGTRLLGVNMEGPTVTLDMQTQFVGAGMIDMELIAEVELVRETRSLIFVRGEVIQEGRHKVAAFSAIIKRTAR